MTLLGLKWLALVTVFIVSLLSGFLSLGFANRYQKLLDIGDAAANGIFIGAALFHLLPSAVHGLHALGFQLSFFIGLLFIATSFAFLWLIEHVVMQHKVTTLQKTQVWLLTMTLSAHALIAGISLGISDVASIVWIIFIAIMAHKGFETFAFVMNLHRRLGRSIQVPILLVCFSLVTPIGILIGLGGDTLLDTHWDAIFTATFSAFAAGTFLYIGSVHRHPLPGGQSGDSHHQYSKVIATISGVTVMAILGLWI